MLWGLRCAVYVSPVITLGFIFRGDFRPRTGIIENSNLAWLTLFVFGTVVALFALREHYRLYYGIIELLFSLVLIWIGVVKIGLISGSTVHAWSFGSDATFALAAAVYVGVRALDNIGQGIDKYPNLYRVWLWFFLYSWEAREAKVEAALQKHEKAPQLAKDLAFEGQERPIKKHMKSIDLLEQKKNIAFPWHDAKAKSPPPK